MNYFAIATLLSSLSVIATADLMTQSNDYYMTPNTSTTAPVPQSSGAQEQCWYEQVPISGASQADESPNVAGAVVGGIVGGIVGHQFGSGSGNTAATITGAALGTAIGANSGTAPATPQYQLIKKCNTVH